MRPPRPYPTGDSETGPKTFCQLRGLRCETDLRRPCCPHFVLPEARMTPPPRRLTADDLLDRLLDLWTDPAHDDAVMLARFGSLYTDPVLVNGAPMALVQMVDRARMISNGLGDVSREVIDLLEDPAGRLAFAFRLRGRHVGPLPTPLGPVPATGRDLDVLGIDLVTVDETGHISAITVLSGLMDVLAGIGALELKG